ncbi:sensor histidine kinase [Actinosynnema sp. NPDC023587]|uniref:sensor histidine kinase n=1 Tax=Actinosynnema sp. NPDC023587 TaxID=3154695 RepID=UPI0033E68E92
MIFPARPTRLLPAITAAVAVTGVAWLEGARASPAVLAALGVAVAAPLAWHRAPVAGAAVSAVVALVGGTAVPGWSGGLVAAAACYLAAYRRPQRAGTVLALSVLCFQLPLTVGVEGREDVPARLIGVGGTPLTQALLMGIAPVAVGYAMRLRRDRARQAVLLRDAEAVRIMAEERTVIAREVHDAVGHHLTAIRMQANAARHVLGGASPVVRRVLDTIDDSASSALEEVRTVLAMLREAADGARLTEVEALAGRLSAPSCPVTVERHGGGPLPGLVDHGAYRLVQEALTNAVRHAGASRVHVTIRQDDRAVALTVEDDGPGRPDDGPPVDGHGLRGMRERARLLGGSLDIAAREPRGWLVRATLPVDPGPAAGDHPGGGAA